MAVPGEKKFNQQPYYIVHVASPPGGPISDVSDKLKLGTMSVGSLGSVTHLSRGDLGNNIKARRLHKEPPFSGQFQQLLSFRRSQPSLART